MLQWLRALKGSAEKTQLQRVQALDFTGKPVASAICLCAASLQDEAVRDLKKMGATPSLGEKTSLADLTVSAAIMLAYHTTIEACVAANVPSAFLPLDPVPKSADPTVAFSIFMLAGIKGPLSVDGIEFDFSDAATRTALQFYFGHEEQECVARVQRGLAFFQAVAREKRPNVVEWQENSLKLMGLLIEQLQPSNDVKQDLRPLFGSQLSALVASVH